MPIYWREFLHLKPTREDFDTTHPHSLNVMTTYIWKINTLERETSDGFVFTAHWSVTAISDVLDPEGNPYNAGAYGSIGLERPDNLIPYEDLTEDLVIGWVQEKLGGADKVKQIENALDARIAEQINPSKINGVPWGN